MALQGQYRINLYDPTTGDQTATIEDWQRLELRRVLNGVGSAKIQLDGAHPALPYFENNALVEVWRQIPGWTPNAVPAIRQREGDWYCEWDGLYTDYSETVYSNNNDVWVGYCDGLLDLVQRREILWYATVAASESKKVAIPSQTAIYEFVEENLGASAVAGAPGVGRLVTGTLTAVTIPVLTGNGPNWSGQRAWRNVLETIQEIGNFGSIDFDVISQGDGTFVFETYPDQLGEDRTNDGLDPSTGLNSEGNVPVLFALELDNIEQVTISSNRSQSKNVVATPGKGEYTARNVGSYVDATDFGVGRINQRELVRNASTQDDAAELDTLAEEWGIKLQFTEDFKFVPLTVESTLYGVHYWFGDKITARFRDIERNKRLTALTIMVDRRGETLTGWNFQTLP